MFSVKGLYDFSVFRSYYDNVNSKLIVTYFYIIGIKLINMHNKLINSSPIFHKFSECTYVNFGPPEPDLSSSCKFLLRANRTTKGNKCDSEEECVTFPPASGVRCDTNTSWNTTEVFRCVTASPAPKTDLEITIRWECVSVKPHAFLDL